jgi:hypothetical protein
VTVELDHIFICTVVGAPEADRLVAFGLTEGTSNSHSGQGTANRRFFLRNAMLELLWVHDEHEARSSLVAPTRLWERWQHRSTGYSPFGICFRPSTQHAATRPTLPFATWTYHPPYLPPELQIDIAAGTDGCEPLLFLIPFGKRPDSVPIERRQPLVHSRGSGEITALHMTLPQREPASRAVRAVQGAGLVSFGTDDEHLAEIEFDHGGRGQSDDFRPVLPLRFRW